MEQEASFLQEINERRVEAYKRLYDEFYPALVVYASTFVASDQVAEDIVQELFVTMWEKQVTFISFLAFKTYLYKYIKNAALIYLKHQDVEGRYVESLRESATEDSFMEEEINKEEEYRLLFQAIDELPPRCREIFLLSLEGKKNKEIAEMLQVSTETIKTQKMRAMKHLKERTDILFSFLLSVYAVIH